MRFLFVAVFLNLSSSKIKNNQSPAAKISRPPIKKQTRSKTIKTPDL
jgi:hypothetical protein